MIKILTNNYSIDLVILVETHGDSNTTNILTKKCNFDKTLCVDATSQLGGIWCLWRDSWDVEFIYLSMQTLHLKVSFKK